MYSCALLVLRERGESKFEEDSRSVVVKKDNIYTHLRFNRTEANRDGSMNRLQNILNCLISVAWTDGVLSVIEIIYERS